MADRFFCPGLPPRGPFTMTGAEAHHLARVRRLGPGDAVELFDGRGSARRAEVVGLGRDRVELEVDPEPLPDRAPACRITLATAIPKGDRFDWLVEKATELGVDRLVPILAERSVVAPRQAKLDRLRRTIVEASKQCGRNRLMDLAPPIPWPEALRTASEIGPTRLIAHPGGAPASAWSLARPDPRIALAVGPEGGFTPAEVEAATAAGFLAVSLGPTLLRVETAALVGSAAILARFEVDREPPDRSIGPVP